MTKLKCRNGMDRSCIFVASQTRSGYGKPAVQGYRLSVQQRSLIG